MVTCYLRYIVDPLKLAEFETYARMWIPLVEKFGGKHHGYFMPSEGVSNVALALFSFPSLADLRNATGRRPRSIRTVRPPCATTVRPSAS